MAQIDITGVNYFLPLLSFLVVLIFIYFILHKVKLIENKFFEFLVAFIMGVIFVSAVGPQSYILVIIPWFAILIVAVFLMAVLTGFLGGDVQKMAAKPVGIVFIVLLVLAFVVSFIFVFSSYFSPYLPWNSGAGGNPDVLMVTDWLKSPRVAGSILLIAVGAVVGWILVKMK